MYMHNNYVCQMNHQSVTYDKDAERIVSKTILMLVCSADFVEWKCIIQC